MENITKDVLRSIVKNNARRSETITQGKKFKVFKNYVVNGQTVNILAFNKGEVAFEKADGKVRYIELNDYLISAPSARGMPDYIDFYRLVVYDMTTGESAQAEIPMLFHAGGIVIIDEKLIAACSKSIPRFFAVIEGKLRELPAATAEQIIRLLPLPRLSFERLKKFFGEEWPFQNGIFINPQTLDVPSSLHYGVWRRSYPAKNTVKPNIDLEKLLSIFKRDEAKETPVVKYVNSAHFKL